MVNNDALSGSGSDLCHIGVSQRDHATGVAARGICCMQTRLKVSDFSAKHAPSLTFARLALQLGRVAFHCQSLGFFHKLRKSWRTKRLRCGCEPIECRGRLFGEVLGQLPAAKNTFDFNGIMRHSLIAVGAVKGIGLDLFACTHPGV